MQPRIDWWNPVMNAREKQLLCEVVESNFPNDGHYTTAFEQKIAELCDVPYAVGVTSGTVAIFLGLVACGVGVGDEVIVPDITFIATANAVTLTGAKPIFVDIDPATFCIDPACVKTAITPRTKAIVPVHISGRAAALPALLDIAREHGLRIVEDAAEALGSYVHDRALGTLGNVGCFSFTANKLITTGQGGMVVTKDATLYRRLRELKDHDRPAQNTGGADEHVSVGYNFKFTNLQAALGLAQLESFAVRQEHQRHIFRLYQELLSGVARVRLPGFNLERGECPLWVDALVEDRDGLHDYLLARHIHTRKFWYPLHTQPPYRCADQQFPMSMQVSSGALWLPSALTLTDDDVSFVCQHIRGWAKDH